VVVYLSPLIIARGDHEKVEIEVIEMNDNKITFKATIREPVAQTPSKN